MAWATLYRSFSATDRADDNRGFGRRTNDALAIKLQQFLAGRSTADVDGQTSISHALRQVTDPVILEKIHSKLVKELSFPQLILGTSTLFSFYEARLYTRLCSNTLFQSTGAYLEPELQLQSSDMMILRSQSPQNLTHVSYPYQPPRTNDDTHKIAGACSQNGAQWLFPTFHPSTLDYHFDGNVFRKKNLFDMRWDLAMGIGTNDGDATNKLGYCPVDADPYLPWIHDAFPSNDGSHIKFIISNKRRCNSDPKVFQADLKNLEPQVALMQPIPVKRLVLGDHNESEEVTKSMSKLWSPDASDAYNQPRYRLATSLEDADEDVQHTRFICRFHTVVIEEGGQSSQSKLKRVVLGESLSNYPYNPEHANYRKRGSKPMLTSLEQGHDEQIWNSVYEFRCPTPIELISTITSGASLLRDIPSIYVDLVPIRTPVRRDREGFGIPGVTSSFDPIRAWGNAHVLPHVAASGRWANVSYLFLRAS